MALVAPVIHAGGIRRCGAGGAFVRRLGIFFNLLNTFFEFANTSPEAFHEFGDFPGAEKDQDH